MRFTNRELDIMINALRACEDSGIGWRYPEHAEKISALIKKLEYAKANWREEWRDEPTDVVNR